MSCFIRSGAMNLSKSCVPFGIAPNPSASVMVISFDQAVALGVDSISSPLGRQPLRKRVQKYLRVGGMLDHLHGGDQVERAFDILDRRQRDSRSSSPCPAACSRAAAISFRGGSIAVTFAPSRASGSASKPGAAADIERALALERTAAVLVERPVLVDPVADVGRAAPG